MKTVVFFAALLTSALVHAQVPWTLNDVSYLMPLPKKLDDGGLIRLQSSGLGGAVLPQSALAKIPTLSLGHSQEEVFRTLRVMGVRIDPCFPLPTPQSCQRQVRLVWQPLDIHPRFGVRTVDAALHSFYILNDQQFSDLLKDLQQWKKQHNVSTAGLPLQLHPAWAVDGTNSSALQDFNEVILKYVGVQNLSRVTAMVLRGAGDMWAFVGYNFEQGQLKLFPVPRIQRSAQTFVNLAVPADQFANGQILPRPEGDDTFNNLMEDSGQMLDNDALLLKEFKAITRIEDPREFTPENMDCVSCHVAQQARTWSILNRRDLGLADLWSKDKYSNAAHNMENKSTELLNTQSIRAFGYFDRSTVISQRVINESAEVADAVNAWLKSAK